MEKKGDTIKMIDMSRGIVTIIRKLLIRFKQVTIHKFKDEKTSLTILKDKYLLFNPIN